MPRALAAILAALPFVSGCDPFGPETCDTGIHPAVTVAVVDAASGASLTDGATGTVQDGSYSDSLRVVRQDAEGRATLLGAAFARPGTYTVVVQRPGYATWTRSGVRTRSDACHARAPELRAALTAAR